MLKHRIATPVSHFWVLKVGNVPNPFFVLVNSHACGLCVGVYVHACVCSGISRYFMVRVCVHATDFFNFKPILPVYMCSYSEQYNAVYIIL